MKAVFSALVVLTASLVSVQATTANCKRIRPCVSNHQPSFATSYCSSYLGITTSTVVAATPTSTTTVTAATPTSTSTVTAATATSTSTVTAATPTSTSTSTTTTFTARTTTINPSAYQACTISGEKMKRDIGPAVADKKIHEKPFCLRNFTRPAVLSAACDCLDITSPVTTSTPAATTVTTTSTPAATTTTTTTTPVAFITTTTTTPAATTTTTTTTVSALQTCQADYFIVVDTINGYTLFDSEDGGYSGQVYVGNGAQTPYQLGQYEGYSCVLQDSGGNSLIGPSAGGFIDITLTDLMPRNPAPVVCEVTSGSFGLECQIGITNNFVNRVQAGSGIFQQYGLFNNTAGTQYATFEWMIEPNGAESCAQ